MTSSELPAGAGTTMRTGHKGQVCAMAAPTKAVRMRGMR